MAANQPSSPANGLPVIETVLAATQSLVLTPPTASAPGQTDEWKELEDRIAAWAPANGEPDARTDEDGYLLPNREAIALALQIAARLRAGGIAIPIWVVQDGNGGIDFEWKSGDRVETLSVNALGETELLEFENSKLICRRPVSFSQARR
jgi:hypothetical protein